MHGIARHLDHRAIAGGEDARSKGAVLVNLAEQQDPDVKRRKFPPHLVLNPTEDMIVMQREIFGPLLPIKTYRDRDAVAAYVNARPRPLALYLFTHDAALQDFYIDHIMSGGVTVNDGLLHSAQHSLPFGGVGASGMGHYHGYEGFLTFSKLRPIFYQGSIRAIDALMPPYRATATRLLNFMLKRKS
jgi:coniferyl-aldehyde dehydrogenase